jgi:hypothetical protein
MTARRGEPNNLFLAPGGAIVWDETMLGELERCIRAELSARATAKRLGVNSHTLGRGAMILCWHLMVGGRL